MSQRDEVEVLSSQLHDIYIQEAKRQGDVRHKDKYEDLTENIKEFDRVLARFILARERALIERVERPLKKEFEALKSYFEGSREVVLHVNDIDWKAIDEALRILEQAKKGTNI